MHRAGIPEVQRGRAGVDAADADDPLGDELVVEAPVCPEVRDDAGGIANGETGDPDAARLRILVVHPGVADVRRGHQHDLPGVGRVGDGLLVAGHAGREDRLAEGRAEGAVGGAGVTRAVFENQHGGVETLHRASPSI
jgi:hypothetical protein